MASFISMVQAQMLPSMQNQIVIMLLYDIFGFDEKLELVQLRTNLYKAH